MTALHIAKQMIKIANQLDIPITNMKLHNLLLFVQLVTLKTLNWTAFDDDIVANINGVKIKEVYEYFKGYVADDIILYEDIKIDNNNITTIIECVLKELGNMNYWTLSNYIKEQKFWLCNFFAGKGYTITVNDMKEFNETRCI